MPNRNSRVSAKELFANAEKSAKARQIAGQPVLRSPVTAFNADASEATVYIYDAIGDWFGIDPMTWVPEFDALTASTIHLRINSPGGSVFDAEAMRAAIRRHPANVIAHIDGMAASAATGIALAANDIEMSDGAMFMIHNAWGWTAGNAEEMRGYAALLDKADSGIVATYVRKTGASESQVRAWMRDESWFTAAEALEHGFIDRIFTDASDDAAAGADDTANADPSNVADDAERARRLRMLLLAEAGL